MILGLVHPLIIVGGLEGGGDLSIPKIIIMKGGIVPDGYFSSDWI
jgi:hypothetical protein